MNITYLRPYNKKKVRTSAINEIKKKKSADDDNDEDDHHTMFTPLCYLCIGLMKMLDVEILLFFFSFFLGTLSGDKRESLSCYLSMPTY